MNARVALSLDTIGDRLERAALADVAKLGFDGLSLRTIAAQADCTTGAIVQRFANRDGLLRAACVRAMAQEADFHRDLAARIDGLALTPGAVLDLIGHYIATHAPRDAARLFLWAVVASGDAPLADWHTMRQAFWHRVLDRASLSRDRGDALVSYVMMEEYYATALADDTAYALLLPESVRAFCRFDGTAAPTSIAAVIDEQPRRMATGPVSDAPVRERLVRAAADEILAHGVAALNRRHAARIAQASPSAITYHFGDMERFIDEAIWSALLRGIPRELDPASTLDNAPGTMEQWLGRLVGLLHPRRPDAEAGFYTNFARITGEMCLLVASRPALRPLAHHLRALEGWGTHRASRHLTDPSLAIRRDHAAAFAIWIKGEAILRNCGAVDGPITAAMLIDGARAVFPRV